MTDVLRELQDDIRRDRAAQWWKRNGAKVTVSAIVVVAIAAGAAVWKLQSDGAKIAHTMALATASGIDDAAAKAEALGKVAGDEGKPAPGIAILAAIRQGNALAKAGNQEAAAAAFGSALGVEKAPPVLHDFAALRQAQVLLAQSKWDEAVKAADPLTVEGNAWRWSALEVKALGQLQGGHAAEAAATAKSVPPNADIPDTLNERLKQIAALAGDAQ